MFVHLSSWSGVYAWNDDYGAAAAAASASGTTNVLSAVVNFEYDMCVWRRRRVVSAGMCASLCLLIHEIRHVRIRIVVGASGLVGWMGFMHGNIHTITARVSRRVYEVCGVCTLVVLAV